MFMIPKGTMCGVVLKSDKSGLGTIVASNRDIFVGKEILIDQDIDDPTIVTRIEVPGSEIHPKIFQIRVDRKDFKYVG